MTNWQQERWQRMQKRRTTTTTTPTNDSKTKSDSSSNSSNHEIIRQQDENNDTTNIKKSALHQQNENKNPNDRQQQKQPIKTQQSQQQRTNNKEEVKLLNDKKVRIKKENKKSPQKNTTTTPIKIKAKTKNNDNNNNNTSPLPDHQRAQTKTKSKLSPLPDHQRAPWDEEYSLFYQEVREQFSRDHNALWKSFVHSMGASEDSDLMKASLQPTTKKAKFEMSQGVTKSLQYIHSHYTTKDSTNMVSTTKQLINDRQYAKLLKKKSDHSTTSKESSLSKKDTTKKSNPIKASANRSHSPTKEETVKAFPLSNWESPIVAAQAASPTNAEIHTSNVRFESNIMEKQLGTNNRRTGVGQSQRQKSKSSRGKTLPKLALSKKQRQLSSTLTESKISKEEMISLLAKKESSGNNEQQRPPLNPKWYQKLKSKSSSSNTDDHVKNAEKILKLFGSSNRNILRERELRTSSRNQDSDLHSTDTLLLRTSKPSSTAQSTISTSLKPTTNISKANSSNINKKNDSSNTKKITPSQDKEENDTSSDTPATKPQHHFDYFLSPPTTIKEKISFPSLKKVPAPQSQSCTFPLMIPSPGYHVSINSQHVTLFKNNNEIVWKVTQSMLQSMILQVEKASVEFTNKSSSKVEKLVFLNPTACLDFVQTYYRLTCTDSSSNASLSTNDNYEFKSPFPSSMQSKFQSNSDSRKLTSDDSIRDGDSNGHSALLLAIKSHSSTKEETTKTTPLLTKEEEAMTEKYRKMLKMSVPPEAVRHSMTKDGIAPHIIAALLDTDSPSSDKEKASNTTPLLTKEEEAMTEKYRRMLKMSIPPEAVRHSMAKDGIAPHIIEAMFGVPNKKASEMNNTENGTGSIFSADEEKIIGRYRKMLKINIPAEAVRQKMVLENVHQSTIDKFLNELKGSDKTDSGSSKQKSNLKNLHWNVLSGKELEQSVWNQASANKRKRSILESDQGDFSTLEELFQKQTAKRNANKNSDLDSDKSTVMANIVPMNRAQNVSIMLKAFKDFDQEEIVQILRDFDPENKIKGERVLSLKGLLPTDGEVKALKIFKGTDNQLIPVELFFRKLLPIERLDAKVGVIQTMEIFNNSFNEVMGYLKPLSRVCNQITESEKLQQILVTVLTIGNVMNAGTRAGDAAGFTFDSLLKLTQTKSMDGKTTVLDYIVMIFIEKDQRSVLDLESDFPDCQTVSRTLLSDMIGEVRSMRKSLKDCRTELIKIKNDQSDKRVTRSMSKKFGKLSTSVESGSDPRDALFNAIHSLKRDEEENDNDPRNNLLASIKNRCLENVSESDQGDKQRSKTSDFTPGVIRLQKFIENANSTMILLEKELKETVQSCKELAIYCGEGSDEYAAEKLLQILSEFLFFLDEAIKKYDKKKEEDEKKAQREKKKQEEAAKRQDAPSLENRRGSLEKMVSEMLLCAESDGNESSPNKRKSPDSPGAVAYEPMKRNVFGKGNLRQVKKNADPRNELMRSILNRASSMPSAQDKLTKKSGDSQQTRDASSNIAKNERPKILSRASVYERAYQYNSKQMDVKSKGISSSNGEANKKTQESKYVTDEENVNDLQTPSSHKSRSIVSGLFNSEGDVVFKKAGQ